MSNAYAARSQALSSTDAPARRARRPPRLTGPAPPPEDPFDVSPDQETRGCARVPPPVYDTVKDQTRVASRAVESGRSPWSSRSPSPAKARWSPQLPVGPAPPPSQHRSALGAPPRTQGGGSSSSASWSRSVNPGGGPGLPDRSVSPSPAFAVNTDLMGEDPWGDILAQSTGEFCYIPAATLDHLKYVGQAQLAEIAELRRLLATAPDVEAETRTLEVRLRELEIARVMAENELELRRQEAGVLAQEAARLREERDSLQQQALEADAKIEQLEAWLDPFKSVSAKLSPRSAIFAASAEATALSAKPQQEPVAKREAQDSVGIEAAILEAIEH